MIWILRHGDAEAGEGKPDADRDLTEKGERQSVAAGQALKKLGVEIDVCLTSPKVRAKRTAELACSLLIARLRRTTASGAATSTRSTWPPDAAR